MAGLSHLKHFFFNSKGGEKISYYYNQKEDKPCLLLIHGNASSATEWSEVIDKYHEDYNILVPEMRGFGDSSYNKPVVELIELARDLVELVDALHWGKMIVIAWSLGGGVAAEFCHLIPDRVTKLVLTASMWLGGYPMYEINEQGYQLDKPLKSKEEIAKSPYYLPGHLAVVNNDEKALEAGIIALFARVKPERSFIWKMKESMRKQQNTLDVDYALLIYNITDEQNASGFPGSGHYHDLTMPILLLHGTKDVMVSDKLAHKNKALLGEKAELDIFPGGGHALHLDFEDQWYQRVNAFLKE